MAAKGGFSIADLQQGAKKLQVSTPSDSKSSGAKGGSSAQDSAALNALEDLYEKHDGNLDLMQVHCSFSNYFNQCVTSAP